MRILLRDFDCLRISVAAFDSRLRKHPGGGDSQDAGPSPHIKKAAAAKMFLDGFQTEPRGFMCAGAEGHAGIDANCDSISSWPARYRRRVLLSPPWPHS